VYGIEALYDAHGALCYRLARRIVVDAQLAEDVVQDVFLAVWAGRAGVFDPTRGTERAWLMHITHRRAVDKVRRNERHASRNAGTDMFSSLVSDSDVESDAWGTLRREHVVAAMAELSGAQRLVLELGYFGRYTQAEIAKLTSTPLGTVKTRTASALRQLRANLDLADVAVADGWKDE
jgi:RNA polymerase sigma-70 factor (ECF subfamily)